MIDGSDAPSAPAGRGGAASDVFARRSSGLVKELGAFESFSINLISLGPGPAFGLFFVVLLFVTGANLMDATLLAALIAVPIVVTYSILAVAMPRSGGEYVYASRLLHPYLGFVSGAARMMNVLLYAAVLPYWFVTLSVGPGLGSWGAIAGNSELSRWGALLTPFSGLTSDLSIVALGAIATVVVMALYIGLRPRAAFRLFSGLLLVELAGLVVSVALLEAMGHAAFVSTVNSFMSANGYVGNYYQATASYGAAFGPYGASATNTLLFVPLIFAFYFMFSNAPSYIAGEFRRTARSIRLGLATSFVLAVAFSVALVYAFESVVGMDFLNGAVAGSVYGIVEPGLPSLPFGAGLASLPMFAAHGDSVAIAVIFLGSASWYLLWMILGLYIFSRYALSFSLDRLFPRFLSGLTGRTHAPAASIAIVTGFGLLLLPLVTYYTTTYYDPFIFLLFFLPMISVALTAASLVRLGLQRGSRSLTVAGSIAFGVTGVSAYAVSTLPLLGSAAGFTTSNQTTSYVAIGLVLVGSLIWYLVARGYHRRRSGLDLALAFRDLPPD
jgi:amino acid transporter